MFHWEPAYNNCYTGPRHSVWQLAWRHSVCRHSASLYWVSWLQKARKLSAVILTIVIFQFSKNYKNVWKFYNFLRYCILLCNLGSFLKCKACLNLDMRFPNLLVNNATKVKKCYNFRKFYKLLFSPENYALKSHPLCIYYVNIIYIFKCNNFCWKDPVMI